MSRRKSAKNHAVELFPFLAVLVCVMGSLIFLLLATTRRMHDLATIENQSSPVAALRATVPAVTSDTEIIPMPVITLGTAIGILPDDAAKAAARDQFERQLRQLQQQLEQQITQTERRRDELQAELNRQQLLQQLAQRRITDAEESLGEIQTNLRGTLAAIEAAEKSEEGDAAIAALEDRIIELRRRLRLLQNRPAEQDSKFAIAAFDARSGTTRRPILIECTESGLRFLPEDIVIRPSDLEGFLDRYNPLAAGAAALVDYWRDHDRGKLADGQDPEPYVLMLVRPSGTVGYYIAQKMLSGMPQRFGYELVADEVQLNLPEVDSGAREACQAAIVRCLADRAQVARRYQDGFRSEKAGGNGKSAETFEVADVVPADSDRSGRSWENVDRFEGTRSRGKSASLSRQPKQELPVPEPFPPQQSTAKSTTAQQQQKLMRRLEPVQSGTQPQPASPAMTETGVKNADLKVADSATAARRGPLNPKPANEQESTQGDAPREVEPPLNSSSARPVPKDRASRQPAFHLEHLSRRHWGKSDPAATIGVEHDVTIRVDAKQIVVDDQHTIRLLPDESSQDLFLRVMNAVDAESQTWGKPRPGFYWTPRLRFVISPGGNQAFERIDPHSIRSGLSTTREFTLETVQSAGGEHPR